MYDATQKLAVEERMPTQNILLGFAFASLLCITGVVARYVRHPFGWKALSMELYKVPVIVLMVWRACKKSDSLVQSTAIRFAGMACILSLMSDIVFLLAER